MSLNKSNKYLKKKQGNYFIDAPVVFRSAIKNDLLALKNQSFLTFLG